MLQNKNRSYTCSEILNPVPYFSKLSIQSYTALPVAGANVSKPQLLQSLSLMLNFYQPNVEPIHLFKSSLSEIFPNAASLPQTNHPKSAQNSEKSSYYQRVLTEELLRTFSFGHYSRQSSE